MIVKSVGHWSPSAIRYLINYDTRPSAISKDENGKPQVFKFNIKGNSLEELTAAFAENEANRRFARKEHLYALHEFLSLHPDDRAHATVSVLEDLTFQYLSKRAPNGMAIYVVHVNTDNPHAHIILSPVEIATGNALRISKNDYARFKQELQDYQIEQYPELKHSIVDFDKASEQTLTDQERAVKLRTGGLTRKEEIKEMLDTIFEDSYSREDFYENVAKQMPTYERGGEIKGIEDGERHMRFSTLGYTEEKFAELQERQSRLADLGVEENEEIKEREIEEIENDKDDENSKTF